MPIKSVRFRNIGFGLAWGVAVGLVVGLVVGRNGSSVNVSRLALSLAVFILFGIALVAPLATYLSRRKSLARRQRQ